MSDTVHVFLHDPVFLDLSQAFRAAHDGGGVGRLSAPGLSYFQTLFTITDARATRTPAPAWPATTRATLLLDSAAFADFVALFEAIPANQRGMLFAILDRVAFNLGPAPDLVALESELATAGHYAIYQPGTLQLAPGRTSDPVYPAGEPPQTVSCPDWVAFSVLLDDGSADGVEVDLKVWVTDAAFRAGYPVSVIETVVPPLPLSRLLNDPVVGAGANAFATAAIIAALQQATLDPTLRATDSTGVVTYQARFFDGAANMVVVPFNVLYKGKVPDRLAMRLAVKALLLSVGTESQWRVRCPELFVDSRIWLVPQWNNTTPRVDQVIHPSVIKLAKLLANVKRTLPTLGNDFVEQTTEVLSVAYDELMLAAVPHPLNPPNRLSFRALHPTYQDFATTDPNFQYMTTETRRLAIELAQVLPVAAGKATSGLYTKVSEDGLAYWPFDVGFTEYCVIDREAFLNRAGSAA